MIWFGISFTIPIAHAADPSTSGLLGYWSLDDGVASSTTDSSGNGYTGTLNGTVSWIAGHTGTNAASFSSSTNEYISISNDVVTGTSATSTLTVSAWIYMSGFGGSNAGKVFSNSKSLIQSASTNRISFSNDGGTTLALTASNAVPWQTWTHVVATRNISGQINWYINGSSNGTANQNGGYMATGTSLYIGNRPNGSATQAWAGYIDDFRIYNRVLTGGEITDLYTAASSSPDTLPPNASNGLPTGTFSADTTQVILMASTTENATCKYGTTANTAYASIANTFSTTGTRSHEQLLTGLVGGTYIYYVRCQDLSPNTNASTSDYRITFSITDTTPPVLSSISATAATTTAVVTWSTDEGSNSQINYGLTSSYTASSTFDSSSVTSHSQTLTGLRTGTTYHYRVRSADPSGNISVSGDQTFTTASFQGTPPVVDLYMDMETGSVNASTTKEILTSGTHGSGFTWSTSTPYTAMFISTSSEQTLPISVQVGSGGTIYTDSGTQGWAYDQSVANQSATVLFPSSYNTVSAGGFIVFNTPIPGGGQNQLWDHVSFIGTPGIGSQGAVLQQHLTTSGSLNEVYVHVASTSGSSAGVPIPVTLGQRYWYSMQWNKADLKVYLSLYNPDSWTLVGTSSDTITSDANQDGTVEGLSILEDHGLTASSYIYHDDILVDWSNAKYPLVPDAYAPLVELTSPSGGGTASSSAVTLTASSSDNVAVSGVQFKLDGTTLVGSEDTSSPYTVSWDPSGVADGSHTIVAVSRDINSTYATSSSISVSVDNTAPRVSDVSSDKTNGSYGVGEVIDIDVTFSEAVTSTGNVTITLETGDTDRTCTFTVSGATTGTCNYTVQSGDTTTDLTVSSVSGTLRDATGNTMSNFTPITNLAANKALVIDTTAPVRSSGSPSSSLAGGTTQTTLSLTTDEAATCKYGTVADTAYGSIASTFSTTGGTSHSVTVGGLADSTSYTYYVRCADVSSNVDADDYTISFSVSASSGGGSGGGGGGGGSSSSGSSSGSVSFYTMNGLASLYTMPFSAYMPIALVSPGSVSASVKMLQQALNRRGYSVAFVGPGSAGRETDFFGTGTLAALKRFQCVTFGRCSGPAYGVYDQVTADQLARVATSTTVRLTRELYPGMSGADVRALQVFLNTHGFLVALSGPGSSGRETMYYGEGTRRAVKAFQEYYRADILVPVGYGVGTGICGPLTVRKINALE
jgi:hypothetical protein